MSRRLVGWMLGLLAAGMLVAASPAAAADVAVTIQTAAPEQSLLTQIQVSGAADGMSGAGIIEANVRLAAGVGCQGTQAADSAAAGSANVQLADQNVPNGLFVDTLSFYPPTPGAYLVCAWEAQDGTTPAGPASATFQARGPQAAILSLSLKATPTSSEPFQITYTTQTDQPLRLYSGIRPTGGRPCAADFELEHQQNSADEFVLTYANSVLGGPATSTSIPVTEPRGAYLVCTYVEGPAPEEVDASSSGVITVAKPLSRPELKLGILTASRRHGVTIKGTAAVSGRVTLAATCGKSTSSVTLRIRGGTFTGHAKLPPGCAGRSRVSVSAASRKGSTYAAGSATRSIRISS